MYRRLSLPLLLIVVSCVYFYTARDRAILDDGDALYAHIAQQMLHRGDYVSPYANGVRSLDKPPMMYWLMAGSYRLFGETEFAARFPSAVAVLITSVLVFLIGIKTGSDSAGFIAGVANALCAGTFLFTRMVFPDVLFVCFLTAALYFFLEWFLRPANPALPALMFFTMLAAAVLTKGLIGLFFPLATILIFLLWSGQFRRVVRLHWGKGILLFALLSVPWHVLAARRNAGFLWYYFINEHLLRFLGRRQPFDYESIPLLIFWGLVLLWLFPWSVFLPAIRYSAQASPYSDPALRPVFRLCTSWAIVVAVFFTVSSRIEHYSMPIFPPLTILIGLALSAERHPDLSSDYRKDRWVARGFGALGILGAVFAIILIGFGVSWFSNGMAAGTGGGSGFSHLRAYKFYFAPVFDFPEQIILQLERPLLKTLLALSVGLLGAWLLNRFGARIGAVLILTAMMAVFSLAAFESLGICEEMVSSRQFGLRLKEAFLPGDVVVNVGDYETANSVNFYSPMPLYVYDGSAALLDWGLRYPDAPARLLNRGELDRAWNGNGRVFLLSPDERLTGLGLAHAHPVMKSAGRTLVCNQPGSGKDGNGLVTR